MRQVKTFWQDMTTEDFRACVNEETVAVLPIAATEQHGPHLPVGVDYMLGQAILNKVVDIMPDNLPVTILPGQPVGKSTEHEDYPGTLSLSAETAMRVWDEIGESVHRAGIKKLVFFNSHGGNTAAMDIVGRGLNVRLGMMVVGVSWFEYGLPANTYSREEEKYGLHGGAIETAMMMSAYPDIVKPDQFENFTSVAEKEKKYAFFNSEQPGRFYWKAGDLNRKGPTGDASIANPEKGARIIEHAAQGFLGLLKDVSRYPMASEIGEITSG
ncbi:MAG: creatininase family protein [Rhodospirillales bacterium]|nr:creatininase family protein [Rhodospirillales bacterium]